jgi:DNA-binding MarR family transcriptional regulator
MAGRQIEHLDDWEAQRPDLDPLLLGVRLRLLALGARLSHDNHRLARTVGLSGSELRVLFTLRRVGAPYALRPTDLFEALIVPSGTMTRQIDRLERMGMVDRNDDPEDRRGSIVRLTERGLRVADDTLTVAVRDSRASGAIERLNTDDKAALLRITTQLLLQLDAIEADRIEHEEV